MVSLCSLLTQVNKVALQQCAKRLSHSSLLAFFNWKIAAVAKPPTRIGSRDREQSLADGFLNCVTGPSASASQEAGF